MVVYLELFGLVLGHPTTGCLRPVIVSCAEGDVKLEWESVIPKQEEQRPMPDIYEQIGSKIRELREAYPKGKLSQEALATHLQIASNTVSRWETGTYKPTPEDLDKLARFFKVSIKVFFPDLEDDDERVAALTSATGGLNEKDFEEVVKYAEFRKARRALEGAKRTKAK
jgi:transcriptional regulator with XRE-family HTH domain